MTYEAKCALIMGLVGKHHVLTTSSIAKLSMLSRHVVRHTVERMAKDGLLHGEKVNNTWCYELPIDTSDIPEVDEEFFEKAERKSFRAIAVPPDFKPIPLGSGVIWPKDEETKELPWLEDMVKVRDHLREEHAAIERQMERRMLWAEWIAKGSLAAAIFVGLWALTVGL